MNGLARVVSTHQAFDPNKVVGEVAHVSQTCLSPIATQVDTKGYYPLDVMSKLGEVGAFSAHLNRYGQRFDIALQSMHEISRSCGTTGFLTWCQDVCGLYIEQSGNPALMARLEGHAEAVTFGGTALSNPMKSLSEIERFLLKAKKVKGGYEVSGTLPWVSHIQQGQYCGAMASVEAADGSMSHEIIFLLDITPEVELKACPIFSGMEGSSTWSIRLDKYFVSEDLMIADPARPFIAKIKGAFILLQAGIATGITQASIDSMRAADVSLGHVNQFLHDRPDAIQAELDALAQKVMLLAKTPYETDPDFILSVLDARAAGAELSLKASQSALLHQGAKGYLMTSGAQRLIREAHFVAIVTPAIKHLRWEMNRLMKEEMPA
ncbi:MAG: acyl-CoA/acyl-ACP dehydrogenase [Nitrincola sp.]|nr:acyl-CoA/acyl-ACP dehydrogenase [Nitrincola sp.]